MGNTPFWRRAGAGDARRDDVDVTAAGRDDVFRALPVAACVCSLPDGTIEDCTAEFGRLAGSPVEELRGRSLRDLGMWADPKARHRDVKTLARHGELPETRWIMRCDDGTMRSVATRATSLGGRRDPDAGFVAVTRDITEEMAREVNLREGNEVLAAFTGGLHDVVWTFDPVSTRLRYVSPTVEALTGFTVEEMLSRRVDEILTPACWKDLRNLIVTELTKFASGAFDPAPVYTQEIELRCKDGSAVWMELAAIATVDPGTRRPIVRGVSRDITARRRAVDAITHQSDLMSYVVNHARSAVAVHDREMRYIYVSRRYLDEYGITDPDIIGKHHYDVFPDLPQKWRDVHQRVLAGAIESAEDDPYERADGSTDWTRWECRPWYEQDGSIGGLIVYTEVITDRRRAEEGLRLSEARYRSVVQSCPDAMVITDLDGHILLCSRTAVSLFGLVREEQLLGRHLSDLLAPGDRRLAIVNRERIVRGDPAEPQEYRATLPVGDTVWVEIHGELLKEAGPTPPGIVFVVRDVTERKEAQEELEAYADRLSAMTVEIDQTEERERRRIAEEIHDRVSQLLAVASMRLKAMRGRVQGEDRYELAAIQEIITSAIGETRSITEELAASVLYELGLAEALSWRADRLRETHGLEVHLSVGCDETGVSEDARAVMFRAAGELLTNVAKHSGTSEAWLTMDAPDGWLRITVEDRGVGFAPGDQGTVAPGRGFGLFSIEQRIRQLGGAFLVESLPGEGARISVRLPRAMA